MAINCWWDDDFTVLNEARTYFSPEGPALEIAQELMHLQSNEKEQAVNYFRLEQKQNYKFREMVLRERDK